MRLMKIEKTATFMSNYDKRTPFLPVVFSSLLQVFGKQWYWWYASNSTDDEMFYFSYQVATTGPTHEHAVLNYK